MARPPSSQSSPQLHSISDRELTEVQLHSVDSINDLHRSQHEHALKGIHTQETSAFIMSNYYVK